MPHYERRSNLAAAIELLPSSEQSKAAGRWQDQERRIRNTGLTNSWSWIKTWLDHYGDTVQPTFAFGKLGNQPIGAALITKATHRIRGIPIPSEHLGTAGEPPEETTCVEYNRLLVAPENLDALAAGLIPTLQQGFRWSELRLDGFVPEHAKEQLSNTESDLIWTTARRGPRMWLIDKAHPPFQLTRELLRSILSGKKQRSD